MNEEIITFFKSTFLFSGMSDAAVLTAMKDITPEYRMYAAKECIYSPTDYDRKLAFVLSGECNIERIKSDGGKVPLNTVSAGGSFGIVAVLTDTEEFPTEVSAKTKCEIIMIQKHEVKELIFKNPVVCENLISFLAGRISFLNKKIATFASDSVEEKLTNFLLNEAERRRACEFPFNAKKTAEAINSGRASLYRAIASLTDKGIITLVDKKIFINDLKGLERITK